MARSALEGLSHHLDNLNEVVETISGSFKDDGEFKFTELSQIPDTIKALINRRIDAMGFKGRQAAAIRDYVIWALLDIDDPVSEQNLFQSENVEL